jgi:DNA-directed RNA polymerase subunit F
MSELKLKMLKRELEETKELYDKQTVALKYMEQVSKDMLNKLKEQDNLLININKLVNRLNDRLDKHDENSD